MRRWRSCPALDAYRVVFVDGVYAPELSTRAEAAGLEIVSLAAALKSGDRTADGLFRESAVGQEAVIALNTAFMTDGAVVRLAAGTKLDKPLLLVFARAGKEGRLVTTRNIIEIGDGAHATVIEAHVALSGAAPGQANTLSDVALGAGAHLAHVKVTLAGETREPPGHLAGDARAGRDATTPSS